MAISKLVPGPAAATHSMSRFGLRSREKSTGTGLAQPNNMALPPSSLLATRIAPGTRIVPTGSTWRSGFRLMRPAR